MGYKTSYFAMLLRSKSKESDLDLDQLLVGDLAVVKEEVIGVDEPPSQAGAVTAITLAMFCALRAFDLASSYGFRLRFAGGRGNPFDLRPTIAIYAVLTLFLLLSAPKFTSWFAPGGQWRVGKLVTAAFAFLLIMISVQPVSMLLTGFNPTGGRMGNFLSLVMDYEMAAYSPLLVGIVLLLITGLAPRYMGAFRNDAELDEDPY